MGPAAKGQQAASCRPVAGGRQAAVTRPAAKDCKDGEGRRAAVCLQVLSNLKAVDPDLGPASLATGRALTRQRPVWKVTKIGLQLEMQEWACRGSVAKLSSTTGGGQLMLQ